MSRRLALLAVPALLLAACGGDPAPATVTRTVVVTTTATPTPAPTSSAPTPSATPTASTHDASAASLRTATVPRFNERPVLHLQDGRARVGSIGCALDDVPPVLADVDGDGATEAIGSLTCTNGAMTWPSELLVVDGDGSTLTSYSLARPGHARAAVDTLAAQPGAVTVRWHTFDAGRADRTPFGGTLRVQNRVAVLVPDPTVTATTPAVPATPTVPGMPTPTVPAPPTGARTTRLNGDAGFASPSGGIVCHLGGSVRCDVLGARFTAPPKPRGCEYEWGFSFALEPGRAGHLACQNDPAYSGGDQGVPAWFTPGLDGTATLSNGSPVVTLGYGHVLETAALSCVVGKTSGVTCRTRDGAHGFTASRARYRTW